MLCYCGADCRRFFYAVPNCSSLSHLLCSTLLLCIASHVMSCGGGLWGEVRFGGVRYGGVRFGGVRWAEVTRDVMVSGVLVWDVGMCGVGYAHWVAIATTSTPTGRTPARRRVSSSSPLASPVVSHVRAGAWWPPPPPRLPWFPSTAARGRPCFPTLRSVGATGVGAA